MIKHAQRNLKLKVVVVSTHSFDLMWLNIDLPSTCPSLTGTAFPMTGYSIDVSGQSGWTYYPSGVLYAWGQVQVVAATPITITYISADTSGGAGVNFPGFTIMGNPQITFVGTTLSTTRISGYTNLEFTVVSLSSGTILWHAIGI